MAAFEQLVTDHAGSVYWADAAYRLADSAFRQGESDRAAKFANQLLASDTGGDIRGHALYLRGQLAANQMRWPDVVETMQRVLRDFPQSPATLPAEYWVAEAHYRLKNYDEAGRRFQQLLERTADQNEGWLAIIPMRRAQVFAHQRKWLDAREVAEKIEPRFPQFAQQHEVDYLIGRSFASQGKFSDARTFYQKVVDAPTARDSEMAAMAQWMMGETYFHQKKLNEAMDAYHRVYSLYEFAHWRAASLLQSGKCYEAKGETSEAIRLYEQILSDFPQTPFAKKARTQLDSIRQSSTTDDEQPYSRS
jgi:TolA-binding protein